MRLVSRRKLAKYAAEQLLAGNDAVLEEIAGFLIYEKHEREVELLARDIEVELAERGTVVATVESARALDAATKDEIKKLLASNSGVRASRRASGDARAAEYPSSDDSIRVPETDASDRTAQHVELPDAEVPSGHGTKDITVLLRESIDQALIGGFKLRTPTATLDATVLKKLNDLRAKKI